jgi:hypothetical protein
MRQRLDNTPHMKRRMRRVVPLLALMFCAVPDSWPARAADASAQGIATGGITPELARRVVAEVRAEVQDLRGLEFKTDVAVEVVNDDEAREHVLRRLEAFDVADDVALSGEVFELLGLVEPGLDVMEALLAAVREQAGGFYDPAREVFYLLDDMPSALVRVLAAHELTHALEDQHFDLDSRLEEVLEDDDRLFARSAVHEGSATLLMTVLSTRDLMSGRLDAEQQQAMAAAFSGEQAIEELPDVLVRQLLGPYLLGMAFLSRGNLSASVLADFPVADVNRAFEAGPESSEQVLHPRKYWDPSSRDLPRAVSLDGVEALLGRRWTRRGQGVLGELLLGPLVGGVTPTDPAALILDGGAAWTSPAAEGWGGDRWELWTRGKKRVLLLATVWDSEDDAAEFAAALPGGRGLSWRRAGDRVALVAGDAGKRASRLLDALLQADRAAACLGPAESLE